MIGRVEAGFLLLSPAIVRDLDNGFTIPSPRDKRGMRLSPRAKPTQHRRIGEPDFRREAKTEPSSLLVNACEHTPQNRGCGA